MTYDPSRGKRVRLFNPLNTQSALHSKAASYEDEYPSLAEDSDHPERLLQAVMHAAFESLTERMTEVMNRRYYEGMTFREIADELGLAPSTVYEAHQTALEHLEAAIVNSPWVGKIGSGTLPPEVLAQIVPGLPEGSRTLPSWHPEHTGEQE